jgi:hypothetical protein
MMTLVRVVEPEMFDHIERLRQDRSAGTTGGAR